MDYFFLAILWILWCTLHSVLISAAVTERLSKGFPALFRYYRLAYNLFAGISLLPVLVYADSLRGPALVAWQGAWRTVPVALGAIALFLFLAGARRYDFFQFIGLRQIRGENGCSVLTEDCSLDTGGVLSLVRHPWYAGALLVVWARPLDLAAMVTNLVLCGYLVAGAFLEERKLKALFGRTYEEYRQRVSMFFPFKWAAKCLTGKQDVSR